MSNLIESHCQSSAQRTASRPCLLSNASKSISLQANINPLPMHNRTTAGTPSSANEPPLDSWWEGQSYCHPHHHHMRCSHCRMVYIDRGSNGGRIIDWRGGCVVGLLFDGIVDFVLSSFLSHKLMSAGRAFEWLQNRWIGGIDGKAAPSLVELIGKFWCFCFIGSNRMSPSTYALLDMRRRYNLQRKLRQSCEKIMKNRYV